MVVEHQPGGTRLLDVLDRVLDKGIVIDAWIRFQLAGLDLITIDARVVVASIETYINYAESLRGTSGVWLPQAASPGAESMPANRTRHRRLPPKIA
ncbi:MAG TPA: gas vesicle structural protein GvpA [Terriglobales bacterium]|jgi:hypothetical protein